jgi:LacI family transcriptional regulator
MGNPGLSITERRLKGFREACSTLAPTLPLEFRYVGSQQEAREATATYFAQPQPPTAIFSMSDEIMCGVLKALNDLHLRMPGDVSLITISNGLLPGLFSPEISYVETSGYALGKLCFTRMQEMLEGKKFIRENMLSCTYHEGGSL